ncbi:MAG: hypothetical protein ACW976_00395 [Candidatus Ranarchaeia archaeon]|jgi:hypothetical protein
MSVTDLIKKRMENEKKKDDKDPGGPPKKEKPQDENPKLPSKDLSISDLAGRVKKGTRTGFVKGLYNGRETISGSIPGWIKAAVDYIAAKDPKYHGFGGKSRFLAEALEKKIKEEYSDIYKKLNP